MEKPGNPIYQALEFSRAELKEFWRPRLEERLENGPLNMIFYSENEAVAYVFVWDIMDLDFKAHSKKAKIVQKMKIDQELLGPHRELVGKRGDTAFPE